MKYLLLAILFSSLFPISLRIAEKLKFHSKTTIILNFLFGSFFSLAVFIIFTNPINIYPMILAFFLGIPTGIIYYSGLVLYQQTISKNGLSIAALFMKIAMVIPIILSIVIYFDRPTRNQYFGISLAVLAIIILNGGIKQFKGITPTLLMLFLLSGIGDFASKIYQEMGDMAYQTAFIFSTFLMASLLGIILNKKTIIANLNPLNLLLGLIIGIINALSTYFIILTFNVMLASTAIVILNISIIIIVSTVGIILFKEKLKLNELFAYIISFVAILLIAF